MKCEIYRRPELTTTSCRGPEGRVVGQVQRGLFLWSGRVRGVSRDGSSLPEKYQTFWSRPKAEAWVQGTVRGVSARAFGSLKRKRTRTRRT